MNTLSFQNDTKRLKQILELTDLTLKGNLIKDHSLFVLCNAPQEIDNIYSITNSNFVINRYLAGICFSNLDNIIEQNDLVQKFKSLVNK